MFSLSRCSSYSVSADTSPGSGSKSIGLARRCSSRALCRWIWRAIDASHEVINDCARLRRGLPGCGPPPRRRSAVVLSLEQQIEHMRRQQHFPKSQRIEQVLDVMRHVQHPLDARQTRQALERGTARNALLIRSGSTQCLPSTDHGPSTHQRPRAKSRLSCSTISCDSDGNSSVLCRCPARPSSSLHHLGQPPNVRRRREVRTS